MEKIKLKRFFPTKMEIEITPQQLISMFPIELQEHPFMGEIKRVWKTSDTIYSIDTIDKKFIEDMTLERKYLQVKKEKMMDILSSLKEFEIILYYEDKEDIYIAQKVE
ncbi:MAG: hypothetical protein GXO21_03220 [Aquificae bacterium]|nr:hypothetical protein [Aquificota bacterium]